MRVPVWVVLLVLLLVAAVVYSQRPGAGGKWGRSPTSDRPPGMTGGQPGGGPGS
jgi:hypothetical protein